MPQPSPRDAAWPPLPLSAWEPTRHTLHMWTQVVGKVRLALAPHLNHWWEVPLYLTARGLTTSPMPHGDREVEIVFDFVSHELRIDASDGRTARLALAPMTVADFHRETMARLRELDVEVRIWTTPVEVEDTTPFERDTHHAAYDAEQARRWWRATARAHRVLTEFRRGFLGKASPVHFFWGSFDLAATLFSGRRAPPRPADDLVNREAYSHEVMSVGWWLGGAMGVDEPIFYAYAAPEPPGFRDAEVRPEAARYLGDLGEWALPYEAVRTADDPDGDLLAFCRSAYEAAARLGGWDRGALEGVDGWALAGPPHARR